MCRTLACGFNGISLLFLFLNFWWAQVQKWDSSGLPLFGPNQAGFSTWAGPEAQQSDQSSAIRWSLPLLTWPVSCMHPSRMAFLLQLAGSFLVAFALTLAFASRPCCMVASTRARADGSGTLPPAASQRTRLPSRRRDSAHAQHVMPIKGVCFCSPSSCVQSLQPCKFPTRTTHVPSQLHSHQVGFGPADKPGAR